MINRISSYLIGRMLVSRITNVRILGLRMLHRQWIRDGIIPAAFSIRRRLPFI
jgi:hypothetical protein